LVLFRHLERKLSRTELIQRHANTPNITLPNILHLHRLPKNLRCHILRRPSKGYTLLNINNLRSQSKIRNLNLFILDEYIGRFNIPMQKTFGREIMASRHNLLGKVIYFLFITLELVFLDVLFEIFLAVFKEEIEIVCGFLDIEEVNDVTVLQILQSFVLVLHSLDEVGQLRLQDLLDILLLNHLAGEGLVVIFITVGLVGTGKTPPAQAFVHFNHKRSHLLIPLLHS
jgi:hypothetical protein